MSGYLQRLAARASETGEPAVRPSLRSASPIAELDSRIGIPGLDDVDLGAGRSAHASGVAPPPGPPAAAGGDGSPGFPAGIATEAAPPVRRKPAPPVSAPAPAQSTSPAATADASPAASPVATASPARPYLDTVLAATPSPIPAAPAAVSEPLPPPSPEMAAAAARREIDTPADRRAEVAPVPEPPSRRSVDGAAVPETAANAAAKLAPPAGREIDVPSLAAAPSAAETPSKSRRDAGAPGEEAGAEIPRLTPPEPAPRFPQPRPAHRRAPEPAPPRVVIGRIDVEVVPPAATASSERPRPATAAAVSKIGPLRSPLRSNLLFSLRRS